MSRSETAGQCLSSQKNQKGSPNFRHNAADWQRLFEPESFERPCQELEENSEVSTLLSQLRDQLSPYVRDLALDGIITKI
jgi:hypothetical protein